MPRLASHIHTFYCRSYKTSRSFTTSHVVVFALLLTNTQPNNRRNRMHATSFQTSVLKQRSRPASRRACMHALLPCDLKWCTSSRGESLRSQSLALPQNFQWVLPQHAGESPFRVFLICRIQSNDSEEVCAFIHTSFASSFIRKTVQSKQKPK